MNKAEKIIELYYLKHLKQNEIANILDVSNQYVSKIVKKDSRYTKEKGNRKKLNVSKDVPKIIYRNAKVRPQKYKGNCCFNH